MSKHHDDDNDLDLDDLRSISPDTVSGSSDDDDFHPDKCQKYLDSINRRLVRVGELNKRIHDINESIFHKQAKLQQCIKHQKTICSGGKRTKPIQSRRRRKGRTATYRKKHERK